MVKELHGSLVAFAGDWHGNLPWAISRIQELGSWGVQTILHVGDFGIWPGPSGKRYLMGVEAACAANEVEILVTPGNHEDWSRLDQKQSEDRGNGIGGVQWLTDHIAALPRGHRWSMRSPAGHQRTFVSLGGAPSIDYEYRAPGKNWWPGEAISVEDVSRTVAGGHADIMVTHDAPGPPYAVMAVESILSSNPMGWSDRGLAYATRGRELVTEAYLGVCPEVLFHGHYHASGHATVDLPTGDRGLVVSLDCEHTAGNIALFDLDLMEVVTALPR